MKKLLYLLVFLFFKFQNNTYSQNTIEKRIYFEYDKSEISEKSKVTIDSLVKNLNKYYKFSLQIKGHTDLKGTNEYNQKLANSRANEVYKYLINKGIINSFFNFVGAGSINLDTKVTDDKKRFVSIYCVIDEKDKKYKLRNFSSFGGTSISVNIKDSTLINFKITEFFSSKSMIENQMYAIDENENILETAGMITINSEIIDCDDIENEIIIRIPLLNGKPFDEEMTLWSGALNNQNLNRWKNLSIKPKLDNTRKFYEFKIPCEIYKECGFSPKLNIDKPTLSVNKIGKNRAILVAVPNKYNFKDVNLKYEGKHNTDSFSGKINDSIYAFVVNQPPYKYNFCGYFDENDNGKYTNDKFQDKKQEKYDSLLYAKLKDCAFSKHERKIWKYTICKTCYYKVNEIEHNKKIKKKGFFEWLKKIFSKTKK